MKRVRSRSRACSVVERSAGADAAADSAPPRAAPDPRHAVREHAARRADGAGSAKRPRCSLADDLNALGSPAVTRDERLQAFERLQVPRAAALTDATVIRIGQLIGAAQVVVGSLQLEGDTLVVHARSIGARHRPRGRRRHRSRSDAGPLRHLRSASPGASVRDRSADAAATPHPPLPAFEQYIKGLLAETPATAINYLNAALGLQPDFDRARLALWDVQTDQGEHDRALEAVKPVTAASPWFRRARFCAGLSQLALNKNDDAFATFKGLHDGGATAPVLNNLGVVQLRRGSTPQTGQPTYYFNEAAEVDPDRFGLLLQPRVRLLDAARYAGGDLLAARSGAAESGRRRSAFHSGVGVVGGRARGRGRARERAGADGCRPCSSSGTNVRRPKRCRKGSNASRATSSCRMHSGSTRL